MKKFILPGILFIALAGLFAVIMIPASTPKNSEETPQISSVENPTVAEGSVGGIAPQVKAAGAQAALIPEFHCTEGGATSSCYEKYYRDLVAASDAKKAMADLKERYEKDSYARVECHQLSHAIGRAAGEKYGSLAEAYANGSEFCSSGYYHGVTEFYVRKVGKENFSTTSLDPICKTLREQARYSLSHHNCTHGLGHGFMYVDNNELFEALKACDYLSDPWEQSSCHSGVFMENVIADNKNHFTKYLKPEDPMYPCDAVSDHYKQGCYVNQTSYALRVMGGDFAAVFKLCAKVPSPYDATCYQSIGRDASGWSQADPVIAKDRCLLGETTAAQSNCAIGAMKDIVWYRYSAPAGMEFCKLFNAPIRNTCEREAESYAATLK